MKALHCSNVDKVCGFVPPLLTTLSRWIPSTFARFHLAAPFAETWNRKTLQMFRIKVSPSLELWSREPGVRGGQSGGGGGRAWGLRGVLREIWPERRWVPQWVTASVHKDVTRELQETQSLNFSQGAASQMWRHGAATGSAICPSSMPNLKLTGRTSGFF